MRKNKNSGHRLPKAQADRQQVKTCPQTPQSASPTYRLAYTDEDFLDSDELRGMRLALEMMKPEMALNAEGVDSTTVLFGGARIPDPEHTAGARTQSLVDLAQFYTEAQVFASKMTERSVQAGGRDWVVCTGGGPGVMEAGNRGAADAGGRSIALNIVLPFEQAPNAYASPELCFNFHYFAIRKMHFLMRAKVIAVFPGGYGTLDELFETLTLIQTTRMEPVPVILFGEAFWRGIINWDTLVDAGTIGEDDLKLFSFVETADQAIAAIDAFVAP